MSRHNHKMDEAYGLLKIGQHSGMEWLHLKWVRKGPDPDVREGARQLNARFTIQDTTTMDPIS